MAGTKEIGVLLVDTTSGEQIGYIQFDPSGMMVCAVIKKGMHPYATKGILSILDEKWAGQPLYKKYANLLDENKKFSDQFLEQEANSCADFLNSREKPPMMGLHVVKAQVVVREI